MGMNDFIEFFRGMSGKISSNVLAGVQGQASPQNISFMRQLEKEARKKDDLNCPLDQLDVVVFDIETTGFFPDKGDQMISIGAVKMHGCEILTEESFYSLIKTDIPLSPEITSLTNITDEELQAAPESSDVLMNFFKFISTKSLVAHHSQHEQSFMHKLTWDVTRTKFQHRILDTSFLTQLFNPASSSNALEDLCAGCGIEIKNRHHALGDAFMTAHLWGYYLSKAQEAGFKNLSEIYNHIARYR